MPDLAKVESLFHAALATGSEVDRLEWLAAECGGDSRLFQEVSTLLEAHAQMAGQARIRELPPTPSALFGAYRAVSLLGRGGMSAVYLAERVDGHFQQKVALKVMAGYLADQEFFRKFETERQLLAALNHHNITRLLDGGVSSSGDPFLVTEYIDGQSVDRYCEERQLDVEARLRIFLQLCEAVDYAHRNLIVHRDLKPANILVNVEGIVKLLDFGTATLTAGSRNGPTVTRMRMLTPRYASPEQLRGERVNITTDVFSLGVVLYELLTGAWPFGDPNSILRELDRYSGHVVAKPPSTAVTEEAARTRSVSREHLRRALRGDLSAIALKALEADPARRYESVRALATDLENFLAGRPVSARPQTVAYRAGKFLRRRWLASAATLIFVFGVVGSAVYSYRQRDLARKEEIAANSSNAFLVALLNGSTGLGKNATLEEFTYASVKELDREAESGTLEPETEAYALSALTSTFATNGDLASARSQMDRLAALAAKSGSARVRYLTSASRASVLSAEGRNGDAADANFEAYTIAKRELGYDHRTVNDAMAKYLIALHSAMVATASPKPDQMSSLYGELVKRARAGNTRADLLRYLSSACWVLIDFGNDKDGVGYCHEALSLQESLPRSANIPLVYFALATAAEREDDWHSALIYRRKQFDIVMATSGPQSGMGRLSRFKLGQAEFRTGDRDGGLARVASLVAELTQAPDVPDNAGTYSAYADLLARSGRAAEGETWARRAQNIPGHIFPVATLETLGETLALQGKYSEAAEAFEGTLKIVKRMNGNEHVIRTLTDYLEKARRGEPPF
jgi:serine/threonine protein kinase